ncbi:MAG: family 20 glycosylhydrolase [Proteobacteria bacterium]|nr:family 20 glycosylhydrolase [Pseudomonadota bacterium]
MLVIDAIGSTARSRRRTVAVNRAVAGPAVSDLVCRTIARATRGRWTPGDASAVTVVVDPALPAQGYRLSVRPDGISIIGGDQAGAFYGACTLAQLVELHGLTVPCVEIEDHPDLLVRGVMLDISRDKVPTMATLRELIDMLASWKVNQFQLYTEHTFAYRAHAEVWASASPMTAAEIVELDAYCRERFIELVPNQNSFGHLERWFMHDRYRPLAETPGGVTLPWGEITKHPFTLAPSPEGLEFLDGLYRELLPNFTSSRFNVGCDETYDLGLGRSRERVAAVGRPRVWLDFVRDIHALAARHGRSIQVWGDTVRRHPELFADVPRDITILDWGYDRERSLDATAARLARVGQPFYVCPGTSSWTSLVGRTDNAIANVLDAVEAAHRHGAKGVLVTDWGDGGHWQHLPISYVGFAWTAALAWSLDANRGLDLPRALDQFAFRTPGLGQIVWDLGNTYLRPGFRRGNSSILYWFYTATLAEMRRTWVPFIKYGTEAFLDDASVQRGMHETIEWIDATLAPLSRIDNELVCRELAHGGAMARHAARRVLGADGLHAELDALVDELVALWPIRNRAGGLRGSVAKLNASRAFI